MGVMMELLKNRAHKLKLLMQDIRAYGQLTFDGNEPPQLTNFSKPNLRPILLIHGFGTTRRSVSILEKRLRNDGYDVFSINLGGFMHKINTRGIDTLANVVKEKLDLLSDKYHFGKIVIIGHSKGGLIGRFYVTFLKGNEKVKTLITLGTPHNGSHIAIFAALTVIGLISKSVWQMMPHSRFMKRLNNTPIPEDVKTISIFSPDDTVVTPAQSRLNIPDGSRNIVNLELKGFTHTDYLIKRGAYEEIRKYLG